MREDVIPDDLRGVVEKSEELRAELGALADEVLKHFLMDVKNFEAACKDLSGYLERLTAAEAQMVLGLISEETIKKESCVQPLNLSSFGFVALFLGLIVADDAVRTKFLSMDSRWGAAFNSVNPFLDTDLESLWVHGSLTGFTLAIAIFLYDKIKTEWPNIVQRQALDWTIPLGALGLTAAGANAFDTYQVINERSPVIGVAIDRLLKDLGIDSGLAAEQTNVAYEVSVASSAALLGYLTGFKRKVIDATRFEIPLSLQGMADLRDRISIKTMTVLQRMPEGCALPGFVI